MYEYYEDESILWIKVLVQCKYRKFATTAHDSGSRPMFHVFTKWYGIFNCPPKSATSRKMLLGWLLHSPKFAMMWTSCKAPRNEYCTIWAGKEAILPDPDDLYWRWDGNDPGFVPISWCANPLMTNIIEGTCFCHFLIMTVVCNYGMECLRLRRTQFSYMIKLNANLGVLSSENIEIACTPQSCNNYRMCVQNLETNIDWSKIARL